MKLQTLSAAALFGLFLIGPVRADCDDAVSQYNSAVSDIASKMKRYTSCVSGSQGQDDCSSEFRRLRSAQSDFETAVASHQSECQ